MNLTTDELRNFTAVLLQHLDDTGQGSLAIAHDFYWNIDRKELFDPYNKPSSLDLGQLSDDITELRKIITHETPPVGTALVWLAALLRAAGESTRG